MTQFHNNQQYLGLER